MPILEWNKPEKISTTQQWADNNGFEDGPRGGYVPNMAEEDKKKWKAKLVGKTTLFPQVEIRKSLGGVNMTIIVSLGRGYNYKFYKATGHENINGSGAKTEGVNVHIALNGGAQLTFEQMAEMGLAVKEAKEKLEAFP
jgi:hypothetical protein